MVNRLLNSIQGSCSFSTALSKTDLEPRTVPFNGGTFLRNKADRSITPPCSGEVKNAWSYISTFRACFHGGNNLHSLNVY
jgi:hypothetical protein